MFESFDEESYLNRDFDFPVDMSHAEDIHELKGEFKRISDMARNFTEDGTLKLGCDFEKEVIPKLGMSKICCSQCNLVKIYLSKY